MHYSPTESKIVFVINSLISSQLGVFQTKFPFDLLMATHLTAIFLSFLNIPFHILWTVRRIAWSWCVCMLFSLLFSNSISKRSIIGCFQSSSTECVIIMRRCRRRHSSQCRFSQCPGELTPPKIVQLHFSCILIWFCLARATQTFLTSKHMKSMNDQCDGH